MIYRFVTDAGPRSLQRPSTAKAELSNLHEARIAAIRYLGELLQEDGPEFWENGAALMTVSDDTGLTLFTLELSSFDSPAVRHR